MTIEGEQIEWGSSVHGTSKISSRKMVVLYNIAIYFAIYRKQYTLQKSSISTLLGIEVVADPEQYHTP
jgi:hypothetical protein